MVLCYLRFSVVNLCARALLNRFWCLPEIFVRISPKRVQQTVIHEVLCGQAACRPCKPWNYKLLRQE